MNCWESQNDDGRVKPAGIKANFCQLQGTFYQLPGLVELAAWSCEGVLCDKQASARPGAAGHELLAPAVRRGAVASRNGLFGLKPPSCQPQGNSCQLPGLLSCLFMHCISCSRQQPQNGVYMQPAEIGCPGSGLGWEMAMVSIKFAVVAAVQLITRSLPKAL